MNNRKWKTSAGTSGLDLDHQPLAIRQLHVVSSEAGVRVRGTNHHEAHQMVCGFDLCLADAKELHAALGAAIVACEEQRKAMADLGTKP